MVGGAGLFTDKVLAGLISALVVSNIFLVIENRRLSREYQRLRHEIRQLRASIAPADPA